MALADVLRQRVSRRGHTAQVDCGALGTVTVEALPPRECTALGMADSGRTLLYAACRELQAAGETLRRERRLFTPDEVTQYMSDKEARTAARTILALSGVALDEDADDVDGESETAAAADSSDKNLNNVYPGNPVHADSDQTAGRTIPIAALPTAEQKRHEIVQLEAPDQAAELIPVGANRLETVHESVQQISEIRPEIVQEQADSSTEPQAESANRLGVVHKNVQQVPKTQHEIRPGNVQFQKDAPADGQVSREFFGDAETVREIPSIGPDLDFEPQNLALSEENGGFMSSLNLSGKTEDFPVEQSAAHEIKSEIRESVHEITSEIQPAAEINLHEMTSEFGDRLPETLHETKSEFAVDGQQALHETTSEFSGRPPETVHETKSEIGENRREALHETTSELAEQVAQRLLEGLRRAAAVR